MSAEAKAERVGEIILEQSPMIIAYSGGVDSTCLLALAHRAAEGNVLGVIADSPSLPRAALDAALENAARIGAQVEVLKTAEFDILFGEGISREGEIIDMGVNARILDKSGAWYAYNGEKIGQGRDNAREFLRENRDLAVEIENKVRESLGISLRPAGEVAAVAAAADDLAE